jgi:ribosomal protein S18 acetylase RimI-like enzyme
MSVPAPLTGPTVRRFRPDDTAAVYDVCLRTGANGEDATGTLLDPDLLGHVWAGPYLVLQPEHAWVLEDADGIAGYTLGTPDTRAFEQACEAEWWPALRERVADPAGDAASWSADQHLSHLVHHPPIAPENVVAGHPAHLHIDLLPRAQGQGWGRVLVSTLLAGLVPGGPPGVHLGVSPANVRAAGFYAALGFVELDRSPTVVWLGKPQS